MDGKSLVVYRITDDIKKDLYKLDLPYFRDPDKKEEPKKVDQPSEDKTNDNPKKAEKVISPTMLRLKGLCCI